jgi:hypothetical protein
MARGAARNGPQRSVLRPEFALRRRNQPQFSVPAEQHYWMASFAGLYSVSLTRKDPVVGVSEKTVTIGEGATFFSSRSGIREYLYF